MEVTMLLNANEEEEDPVSREMRLWSNMDRSELSQRSSYKGAFFPSLLFPANP